MDKEEKNCLKADVRAIFYENIEEIFFMMQYCLKDYLKSVLNFGFHHSVTKEVSDVWNEFLKNVLEEKFLLNYLIQNSGLEDFEEANKFILALDSLNEEVIQYYYEVLDEIEIACEMKTEWRAMKPNRGFKDLLEMNEYRERLCFMTLSFEDVKMFLGYSEDFWEYIINRMLVVENSFEEGIGFYGVNIKVDNNQCLTDLKVLVPKIINLETALVNVHEFNLAYELYQILGNPIDKSDMKYEGSARDCESKFKEEYIVKKYAKVFSKNLGK